MKSQVRESTVEAGLKRKVKDAGGLALKLVSPGWTGVPDRLVINPDGQVAFVEVKRPGGKPTPLQLKRHETLRKLNMRVEVVDSKEQVDEFVKSFFVK